MKREHSATSERLCGCELTEGGHHDGIGRPPHPADLAYEQLHRGRRRQWWHLRPGRRPPRRGIAVRNSNVIEAGVVLFARAEIAAWVQGIKAGEFDDLT